MSVSKQTSQPSAATSKAYARFEEVIKRSLDLLSMQQLVENLVAASRSPHDLSDMARASIVLAVSAMDGYFTDVFAEKLVPFLKKKKKAPKSMIEFLECAGLNTEVALELLGMARPFRRVRTLVETHLELRVTQHVEAINRLLRVYGFKEFCSQVEGKARRKRLIGSIQTLVRRRHDIAHKGDLNSHGKLKKLDLSTTKKRVMDVVKFVSTAEELIQKRLG